MAKFHINPKTGQPSECRARTRCPYGDLKTEHYSTRQAARTAYEESQRPTLVPPAMSHEPRENWVELEEAAEASVYSHYRRVLRGLKSSRARSTSGERKQKAREETSKRFSVPHSQVKSIVATLQFEKGIPSVADDPIHRRHVEYYAAAKHLEENADRTPDGELICHCGSQELVRVRPVPVEIEIHGHLVPTLNCYACYRDLEAEI